MPPEPITDSAIHVDMSPRYFTTSVVAASPAAAAETIIATATVNTNAAIATGIQLWGWCAFTIGTNGTACNLRIRQTNAAGAVVATTGATTGGIAAANLVDMNTQGLDTAAVIPGQVYVLTLTVTAGSATSTVSAVQLCGLII
jgi:hypothetical protein